ncbi:glycosyltransferase family 2 protein [Neptunitalea lumnitzerae]|uniref:Glycosyl transferase family 2 n=1 Tax=Neptunitalea lumnitzerae TaxID=2965509 RepID=A0ABQ5MIP0_9FLAO|nr:glycosyltransferase family 2 protein [Neptunitalea sp. Y10]GLB49240.1 glycosyl transferase family 2 [Neptunitalea sp. Y10]
MSIAVVILNWNGKALLEKFLPSVIENSKDATIYVADNASTDDSVLFLETNYPNDVTIIKNKENGGYAKGYNDALKHVQEDIFCLLNSDVEVTPDWLTPIEQLFKNESIAVVQPKIKWYTNKDYFEYAGAAGGFIDKYGYPFCKGRIFTELEKDTGQYNKEEEIFWASGACFFIRKTVFEEQQGFDEQFFAHMEEIDLCWRIINTSKKIFYTPESTVYHVGGGTLDTLNPKKTYYNFRNSLFTLLKNLPENQIKKIVFTRMVLDGLAFVRFCLKFQLKHAFAILKAHASYYKLKKQYLRNRVKNVKTTNYFKITSIVREYYINKKKTYKILIKH